MGDECEKFLKNVVELLAKRDGEENSDVMMSLRKNAIFPGPKGSCTMCSWVKETMVKEYLQVILRLWPEPV